MPHWIQTLLAQAPTLTPVAIVDILVTAFLIYQFISILRGRRAANVLLGLGVLVFLYVAAVLANLDLLRAVLQTLVPYSALALILLFQNEIRRLLGRLGRQGLFGFGGRLKHREFINEIVFAVEHLSKEKMGALIVLENEVGLKTFVESGVALDAVISHDLLINIFNTQMSLHDGAVIIQNERIAASACFLPLASNPQLPHNMGTRHRAGIGVTEESDAVSIIVSEETGGITLAHRGEYWPALSIGELDEKIALYYGGAAETPEERERAVTEEAGQQ
ncbi:MAG: TIGR00159 family protein [Acidobacteria bacterium]|nr:TIGR00159 family protein [Acidobacteriota bacterium]